MVMPVSVSATDHSLSSSTFPRMHYGSAPRDGGGGGGNRESREESGGGGGCGGGGGGGGGRGGSSGLSSHDGSGKSNRIPANMLDQFEKQMPVHRDGFHTLQYQRTTTTTTTTTTATESPTRAPAAYTTRCTRCSGSHQVPLPALGWPVELRRQPGQRQHVSDAQRHVPSPTGAPEPLLPAGRGRHLAGDLTLKTSRSNNDGKCSACDGVANGPEARPAYVSSGLRLSDVAPGGSGRRSYDTLGRT
ncbi:hypothetical protein NHX12_015349 [Muraenolepis orangiensis]|uniref:Uncharacterized protein n=1 Tax=Muraenolepis orangiensis TaxID=630683 RepID=A0A9Q0D8Y9_9TELE|nr:hypothetical protein NHX12_015349 [Muraenolepis orangiensis]